MEEDEDWRDGGLGALSLGDEDEEGETEGEAAAQRRPPRRQPNEKTRRRKKTPEEAAAAAQAKVAAQQLGELRRAQARTAEAAADGQQGAGWQDVYWSLVARHGHRQHEDEDGDEQDDVEEGGAGGVKEAEVAGVDEERSWMMVPSMDEARAAAVGQREAATPTLSADHRRTFVEGSQASWDRFYQNNTVNFFKDRHYLHHQFPELLPSEEERTILEYGCGVGNTILPLMKTHPKAHFYATDFSPTAIRLLETHPDFEAHRCKAFVSDLTKDDLPDYIAPETIDLILLVFVLSALAPEHMENMLKKLHRVLKPGGAILFRDYGEYDMAQIRFLSRKNPNKIDECMYVRWDGTTSYFFSLDELQELFGRAGFVVNENKFDIRKLKNRKRKIVMYRVWANSRFLKPRS